MIKRWSEVIGLNEATKITEVLVDRLKLKVGPVEFNLCTPSNGRNEYLSTLVRFTGMHNYKAWSIFYDDSEKSSGVITMPDSDIVKALENKEMSQMNKSKRSEQSYNEIVDLLTIVNDPCDQSSILVGLEQQVEKGK